MQNKETWKNRNPVTSSGNSDLSSSALPGHENLLKKGRVLMDIKEQAREMKSIRIYLFLHIVFIIIFISFSF